MVSETVFGSNFFISMMYFVIFENFRLPKNFSFPLSKLTFIIEKIKAYNILHNIELTFFLKAFR